MKISIYSPPVSENVVGKTFYTLPRDDSCTVLANVKYIVIWSQVIEQKFNLKYCGKSRRGLIVAFPNVIVAIV